MHWWTGWYQPFSLASLCLFYFFYLWPFRCIFFEEKYLHSNLIQILHRFYRYHQTCNIRCTLVGNKIINHSDAVGAAPTTDVVGAAPKVGTVPTGAAPTTSSFSTWHLASMDWANTTVRQEEKPLVLWFSATYIRSLTVSQIWLYNGLMPGGLWGLLGTSAQCVVAL